MKSTIFEGIAERLAEINREEGRFVPTEETKTSREIIQEAFERLDAIPIREMVDPVSYCSVYGHNLGLQGCCIRCGLNPSVKWITLE